MSLVRTFTRDKLLYLASAQLAVKPLIATTWRELCRLGIANHEPTLRGCRAGVNKQRVITTIVGKRPASQEQQPRDRSALQLPPSLIPTITGNRPSCTPTNRGITITNLCSVAKLIPNTSSFVLLNARSVRNKTVKLNEFALENSVDLLAITETWLTKQDESPVINELCPPGYQFTSVPRPLSKGGGVGLLFRSTLDVKQTSLQCTGTHLEFLSVFVKAESLMQLLIVYRPPPSTRNGLTTAGFFEEFEQLLSEAVLLPGSLLIAGDFNFHWDNPGNADVKQFSSILDSMGLQQHVSSMTHRQGHILDLVITREQDCPLESVCVQQAPISDHNPVMCTIKLRSKRVAGSFVSSRKLKAVDCQEFAKDVSVFVAGDTRGRFDTYNTVLKQAVDKHAPVSRRKINHHRRNPWYNETIH